MATVTSTPTGGTLTANKNKEVKGTISWSKPTVPSGATISSCVLTGKATASMSKGSVTITVNGTTVTSGSTFTINLGTANNTTSVDTSIKGTNNQASGSVSFSELLYTVTYEEVKSTYTVTFKDWDGTVLKTQTVEEGSSATAPSNPSRDGYNFTGWDKAFNNITSDLTITAQYTKIETPEPPSGELVEKTEALRPISVTQDSGYNNTWTNVANTYDTDTSTAGTIIVTGSSQSGFKRKYVDTLFNFDTSHIPADATINSATLTIRAKQSSTTNLNITASINGADVIASTLLSSSSANYTADVKDYVKGLGQLNINLTSAATSNRTFTLYDVRIDLNYSVYEQPEEPEEPGIPEESTSNISMGGIILNQLFIGEQEIKGIYLGDNLLFKK